MDGLIMAAQLILGLSILVILHESGHFLTAKWFGMRVEKFYLFFDAGGFKLFSKQIGDTEYGIGWLPLGGYVKISGMVDESLDTEMLSKPAEPYEFRAKPAWQRLIVMLGGVIVNLITGVLIFIGISYTLGERFYSSKEIEKYGIYAHDLAKEMGLKTGDKIIKINGKTFDNFSDVYNPDLFMSSGSYFTVNRNDSILDVYFPSDMIKKMSERKNQGSFIEPIRPFIVGKVIDGTAAQKAGLRDNDKVLMVDSIPVNYFHEFTAELQKRKGKTISLLVQRDNQQFDLKPVVSNEGRVGFEPKFTLKDSVKSYTLAEAIPIGANEAFVMTSLQIKGLGKVFTGEIDARNSLSGPIGMAKMFGGTWNWVRFWNFTGMISMVLAFMNMLPIPALDGGHVVFTLYEIVTRKKPSDKFLEVAQRIGMVILLSLMLFATFNDIVNLF